MNLKIKKSFLTWFAVMPIFCILLDLFMAIIQPETKAKTDNVADSKGILYLSSFDNSYVNQILFFSIWTAILLAAWAICNLINLKNNKMPKWITSKTLVTIINGYLFVVFLTYTATMLFMSSMIQGWDTWYNITKSIIEHFMTPMIMLFYYLFVHDIEVIKTKDFAKKDAFKSLIMTSCYIIFITLRRVMLWVTVMKNKELWGANDINQPWNGKGIDPHSLYPFFPYPAADPFNSPLLYCVGVLFLLSTSYLSVIMFNALSNTTSKVAFWGRTTKIVAVNNVNLSQSTSEEHLQINNNQEVENKVIKKSKKK